MIMSRMTALLKEEIKVQTNIQARSENISSASQLYTIAGILALLSVVLSFVAMAFTDWNNPAVISTPMMILGVLSYVTLLPLVLAIYQHLRPASATVAGISAVAGVLSLVGAATGTVVGFDTTLGMASGMVVSFGLLVFLGLAGYLALSSKLLPAGWAVLSILLGVAAATAGIVSGIAGATSPITGIAWTAFTLLNTIWAIWSAAEFIRRARNAQSAA
jgi:hypothetical protein